jgi:Anticodon binding domain
MSLPQFSLKFTKGNAYLTPGKMKQMQTAAVKALLQNDRVYAEDMFLRPQYEKIRQYQEQLRLGQNTPEPSAPDGLPFSVLVPKFDNESSALELLRQFWELEDQSYADGIAFIFHRWYIFWTVPPTAHKASLFGLINDASYPLTLDTIQSILGKVRTDLELINDWTAEQLERTLTTDALKMDGIDVKGVWKVLRSALVGDFTTPIMTGKNLLFLLGRDETLQRLRDFSEQALDMSKST